MSDSVRTYLGRTFVPMHDTRSRPSPALRTDQDCDATMTAGPFDIFEELIDRFESNWRAGAVPSIAETIDCTPARPLVRDPAGRLELLAELVKTDLEYRWRGDHEPKRLEDYFAEFPDLAEDEPSLRGLVVEEFRVRTRWGDRPALDEYETRFPDIVPQVRPELAEVAREQQLESSVRQIAQADPEEFSAGSSEPPVVGEPSFVEFLATTHPFSELPRDLLDTLAAQARPAEFAEGDYLMRQGEAPDTLLVLLEGLAQVTVNDDAQGEREIAVVGPHAVLGEIGLVTREVRSANVRAIAPVQAAVFSLDEYRDLARRFPTLDVLISELISQRVGTIDVDVLYGKTIGGYLFSHRLGRGSMGIVYKATDLESGSEVAVKMLRHDLVYDREAAKRFQREAAVVRTLEHENIIRVYREFSAYNTRFLSMEYCPGITLSDVIRESAPFSEPVVRAIVGQLAAALHHAHRRGVIHRDLKPANVMLTDAGQLKLADFGLARSMESLTLTVQGQLLGTPRYMAAEQLAGHDADARADIYALGCITWELLTGEPLFSARDLMQLMRQQLEWKLPSRTEIRPDLSEDLYALLRDSLSQEPEERTLDLEPLTGWAAPLPEGLRGNGEQESR